MSIVVLALCLCNAELDLKHHLIIKSSCAIAYIQHSFTHMHTSTHRAEEKCLLSSVIANNGNTYQQSEQWGAVCFPVRVREFACTSKHIILQGPDKAKNWKTKKASKPFMIHKMAQILAHVQRFINNLHCCRFSSYFCWRQTIK